MHLCPKCTIPTEGSFDTDMWANDQLHGLCGACKTNPVRSRPQHAMKSLHGYLTMMGIAKSGHIGRLKFFQAGYVGKYSKYDRARKEEV